MYRTATYTHYEPRDDDSFFFFNDLLLVDFVVLGNSSGHTNNLNYGKLNVYCKGKLIRG